MKAPQWSYASSGNDNGLVSHWTSVYNGIMDEARHECGIAAIYDLSGRSRESQGETKILRQITRMLLDMQTRGQLAAGVTTFNPDRSLVLQTKKDVGSVHEVFRLSRPKKFQRDARALDGIAAIGHTRYATTGQDDRQHAQPFERRHGRLWKWFSFAFNGTLSNYGQLRDELTATKEYHFALNTDTEVIQHFLAFALRGEKKPDLREAMETLAHAFDGAYNLVYLDAAGRMMLARDPLGFRPLAWAVEEGVFYAASESVAISNLGVRNVASLAPGEMIIIERGEIRREGYNFSHQHTNPVKVETNAPRTSRCFFEWVYFANVASTIDHRGVYESRARAGEILAAKEEVPVDEETIVVPVPDSAKAAADSFAYALGARCVEGIFRNRYVGRTFIQSGNLRRDASRSKYSPLPSVLRGKRIFLIEDSIVRSTTLKVLVGLIRERCEPREIHVRVACPPIVAPCFYGIDMSTISELFAARHMKDINVEEKSPEYEERIHQMATELQIDSLRYLEVGEVAQAIGISEESLCMGCVTGRYPTRGGDKLYKEARSMLAAGKRTLRVFG